MHREQTLHVTEEIHMSWDRGGACKEVHRMSENTWRGSGSGGRRRLCLAFSTSQCSCSSFHPRVNCIPQHSVTRRTVTQKILDDR